MPALGFRALLGAVLILGPCGCKTRPQPSPYADADAPDATALLEAARPRQTALMVPRARVKLGPHRGNLAFLAQAPDRFRGSVTIAGNEVASLSLHEDGYHLVYKLDDLPNGYYEGPPSPCAVQALLGVSLSAQQLVAAVLGGAPILDDHQVVSRGWDEERARELLWIRNDRYYQELAFRHRDGAWEFTEARLHVAGTAGPGRRLWTLAHRRFETFGSVRLPAETIVSRPGKRRDEEVEIELKEVNVTPPWATAPDPTSPQDPGPRTPDDSKDATPPRTPADDPWEDDAGEWEGAPGEAPPQEEKPEPEPEPEPAPGPAPTHSAPEKPPIPARWMLSPGGLPNRGDLCRRHR